MQKAKLTVLIGGKTGEHRVNIISSKYVLPAINREIYDVSLVGIDRRGKWYLLDEKDYLINGNDPKTIEFKTTDRQIFPINKGDGIHLIDISNGDELGMTEVFFSLIGGTYAEDGRLQGLLDMLDVAYVGPGVTGSALGMDKVVMKKVLRQSGIPVSDFIGLKKHELNDMLIDTAEKQLGYPIFVKPANLGSSIGIVKAYSRDELLKGIDAAFAYDNKIILEQYIKGREIECAVLGNDNDLTVSVPGEVVPQKDFYDYQSKYIDENGAKLLLPAPLNEEQTAQAQELSRRVYGALDCACFGRVDMFMTADEKWYANEINTIPGFTHNSMYPKLMGLSGIKYSDLIDRLVKLAMKKKQDNDRLKIEIE